MPEEAAQRIIDAIFRDLDAMMTAGRHYHKLSAQDRVTLRRHWHENATIEIEKIQETAVESAEKLRRKGRIESQSTQISQRRMAALAARVSRED